MGCCSSSSSTAPKQDENVTAFFNAFASSSSSEPTSVTTTTTTINTTSPIVTEKQQQKEQTTTVVVDTSQLVSRIFKYKVASGIDENQRLSLAVDPVTKDFRPMVFFSRGKQAFDTFLKNGSKNVYPSMIDLGLTKSWMEDALKRKGQKFAMIVLPKRLSYDVSWDSFIDNFARCVPKVKEYCEKYRHQLKDDGNKFVETDEFKRKYKSVETIERSSLEKDPEIYLTPNYFLNHTEKTFIDFRVLIWTWGGANQVFSGDGFTVNSETGERSNIEECAVDNQTLKEFREKYGAAPVPLEVEIPEE